ncbi:autophagy- protein 17 [Pseudogymnoascus destructans]|uniref:Autophagy-related protein 17 n=1 Tax=Pseudogymnoascus destructans TaxID=655981 RepID=A0A177A6G1_9PEZI|nr:autophagy- protein 17 [Pseudogymnoascus destructans]OAF57042.1 autophagy- protein 17 [Pseudogymnoascus destructans]
MSYDGSAASSSPDNSQHQDVTDIPITTLIQHLIDAKKALSSIGTLWRANEIVSAAQDALGESVILTARTSFLRTGISQQVRLLEKVRRGIQVVYDDGQADFENVIKNLDDADDRLKKTMDTLRTTIVASALRPPSEPPRSLLDFIDENAIEATRSALKTTIDLTQSARSSFASSIRAFDTSRQALKSAITSAPPQPPHTPPPPPPSSTTSASTPLKWHSSSNHSHPTSTSAPKQSSTPRAASSPSKQRHRITSSPPAPVSPDERAAMLRVLAADATELPAVVQDLDLRLQEMEALLPHISHHVEAARSAYSATTAAFTMLERLAASLPAYIAASTSFASAWQSAKAALNDQADELANMRTFYEGYLASYDGLVLEVARRHGAERKMKSVLAKAMEQVERLREADTVERKAFRREVGAFLPSDLWEGLVGDAPRWENTIEPPAHKRSRVSSLSFLDLACAENPTAVALVLVTVAPYAIFSLLSLPVVTASLSPPSPITTASVMPSYLPLILTYHYPQRHD